MASPNQRRIISPKERIKPEGPFYQLEWNWVEQVMIRTKNANCAILWQYFFKNAPEYVCELSSSYCKDVLGFGEKAYKTAFDTLVANGYLKLKEGSRTSYDFIPFP